jgi:HD-GYP domain-containing protein (c-di-GMP phosphodiesterase class II)
MRFRTRAFLCCFIPFALLLAASFWMIESLTQSKVRDGLRVSLLENHSAVARLRSKSDLQSSQFLKVAGENAALKAGVQLMHQYPATDPANAEARRTVEDQLTDLCGRMGFDLLMVSGTAMPGDGGKNSQPLAGVWRNGGAIVPLNIAGMDAASATSDGSGLSLLNGVAYQVASVPIDQADENLGSLSVGTVFDLSQFTTPTVLFHNGRVLESSLEGVGFGELETALRGCAGNSECDVRLHGTNYLSLPLQNNSTNNIYSLRSLQNVDKAVAPVRYVLQRAFVIVMAGALLAALIFSLVSAGSIVRPLAEVVRHLKDAEKTGDLAKFTTDISEVREIHELTESFNRAAASIREGRDNLNSAYVEFVQSLASALDARDRYTAGHSHRVSELSRRLAGEMGLGPETVERVRIGALLHDIGKIGVADAVLQKPGRLTPAEFALVRMHPEIGRKILEGVDGFSEYLPAVELHHENWDGTGYPHGQAGEATPVEPRIIHVTDAYDAMTTDRPYRRGMQPEQAITVLVGAAGTQFDPEIVRTFANMFGDYGQAGFQTAASRMTTMEAA